MDKLTRQQQNSIAWTVTFITVLFLFFYVLAGQIEDPRNADIYPPRPMGEIESTVRYENKICYIMKHQVRYDHTHDICWNKEELEKWKFSYQ